MRTCVSLREGRFELNSETLNRRIHRAVRDAVDECGNPVHITVWDVARAVGCSDTGELKKSLQTLSDMGALVLSNPYEGWVIPRLEKVLDEDLLDILVLNKTRIIHRAADAL